MFHLSVERAIRVAQEADSPYFFASLAPIVGETYNLAGCFDETISILEQVMQQASTPRRSWQIVTLSRALLMSGRLPEATPLAEQALAFAQANKETGDQARALHLLGDVALHHNPQQIDQAKTHYRQALALADELGMRPLHAHCHRDLGTLYHRAEQPAQARAELSLAVDMYREMAMTYWLPETEAVLAAVKGKA